jgi:hypothetical protein
MPDILNLGDEVETTPVDGSMIGGARGLLPKAWRTFLITWVTVVSDTAVSHEISR